MRKSKSELRYWPLSFFTLTNNWILQCFSFSINYDNRQYWTWTISRRNRWCCHCDTGKLYPYYFAIARKWPVFGGWRSTSWCVHEWRSASRPLTRPWEPIALHTDILESQDPPYIVTTNLEDPAHIDRQTGTITREGPRLRPLPQEWRSMVFKVDKDYDPPFQNIQTREVTVQDPRLCPEALLKRGVDVKVFNLVWNIAR